MTSLSAGAIDANRPQPRSKTDLFLSFSMIALQGFGGVMVVVQRELVEKRRWMTREEFVEEWAVAQIMPGPNVINLSIMFGSRLFGWQGAVVGVAGMVAFPLLLVLTLALVYAQFASNPNVGGALRGMGAAASGLITATGLKLVPALRKNVVGFPLCVLLGLLAFAALALLKLPLFWVLLLLGGLGVGVAWRKLP